MYDFETLIAEVLRNRPQLSRDSLLNLIQEKKSSVGGGYLTDQGALFLIAGEFGIPLRNPTTSPDLTLNDLYVGANEITIVARILALYPVAQYKRKKDGSTGKYRRINLFDAANVTKLMVWDDDGFAAVEALGLKADMAIRVVNGYVRQGLDGRPNLNLGRRGRIETIEDRDMLSQLTPMSELEKDVGEVNTEGGNQNVVAVRGRLSSEVRKSSFTRNDGSQGFLTQFRLSGKGGEKQLRVVIWDDAKLPDIRPGQTVRVTNLRIKQQNGGESELHGDEGSQVEVVGGATARGEMFLLAKAEKLEDGLLLSVINSRREMSRVRVRGDVAQKVGQQLKFGDAVELFLDRGAGGEIACSEVRPVRENRPSGLPTVDSLFVKVQDVKNHEEESGLAIDVIALSRGLVEEVQLRDGSRVPKGEVTVGDDTGEIKLVAWRDAANQLLEIEPGERMRILGLKRRVTKMGVSLVEFTGNSVIEKTGRA